MTRMTIAEMDAVTERASALKAAMVALKDAQGNLALLKRHVPEKDRAWETAQSWRPELILKKQGRDYYGQSDITVRIELPYPVVEQQLVYAVERARRAVIALGGMA